MQRSQFPQLEKEDPPPPSVAARARALELACRGAAQVIASRSAGFDDSQEPLPRSSIRLLRRLPRCHG